MAINSCCETCVNYMYDDEADMYCCDVSLDEDEMQHFLTAQTYNCPYYSYFDEYKIVRKQN